MKVEGGFKCDGCQTFLPQEGVVHSGWCGHKGKYYCMSCQKKKKIGFYEPKPKKKPE